MRFFVILLLFLGFQSASAQDFYALGNSLTQDTQPLYLDGNPKNGIYCNQNLRQILNDPGGFCGTTTLRWDVAFTTRKFDIVMVQPFDGTTFEDDLKIIVYFMRLQPDAQFIIHTGWPWHKYFEEKYHAVTNNRVMNHSPRYFLRLQQSLKQLTGRTVHSTKAIDVLDLIFHDIQHGNAPFLEFRELFRDWTHMDTPHGRALMHNVVRKVLGQPYDFEPFGTPLATQEYFIDVIERVHGNAPHDGGK